MPELARLLLVDQPGKLARARARPASGGCRRRPRDPLRARVTRTVLHVSGHHNRAGSREVTVVKEKAWKLQRPNLTIPSE